MKWPKPIASGLLDTYLLVRRLMPAKRDLPCFIIGGTQKGGTTSLYKYLTQHPLVAPSLKKEVHFFDNNYCRGVNWYQAHFNNYWYRRIARLPADQTIITGEASPYYMFHPLCWQRMAEIVPKVKVILLLRNPVDRAFSHYRHNVRIQAVEEPLSFEEAIAAEPLRLGGEIEKIIDDACYVSHNHRNYSYLARGIYIDQLRLLRRFFPSDQIYITSSERFFAQTSKVFRDILQFLNLPEWEPLSYQIYYTGEGSSSLRADTRNRLENYFEPHNAKLYEYLQMDLLWESS